MQTEVKKILDTSDICESNSPWSVPAILVPKWSADGKTKFRFCVDFRALNSVIKFVTYPCWNLDRQPLPYMAPGIIVSLTAIVVFGR
jgi:hypothetical protein